MLVDTADPSVLDTYLDAPESSSQRPKTDPWGGLAKNLPIACTFRHSGWEHIRQLVYSALHRTMQPVFRIAEFAACGSHAYVLQSIDNPAVYRIAGSACHDRFCTPCARERSRHIALNVVDRIKSQPVRFLTLTIKSTPQSLDDMLDHLNTSFRNLRRSKFWKKHVTGGVAFLEITWNDTKQLWHPHLHVLIQGLYLPQQKLSKLWYDVTGDSKIVDIRLVKDPRAAAKYVTKYASKPLSNTYLNRPDRLDEAILALKGRKLLITFGTWRGIALLQPVPEGAWENIGSLAFYIAQAANGDFRSATILESLGHPDLGSVYAKAPKPIFIDQDIPPPLKQLTFMDTWNTPVATV